MKKKIIIIVIVLLLLIVSVFFAVNNYYKKSNKSIIIDNPYGNYENEEELKDTLVQSFSLYNTCSTGINFNINGEEKIYYDDLQVININHIIYKYLDIFTILSKTETENGKIVKIPKSDMENAIKILFGKKALEKYVFENEIIINDGTFTLKSDNYVGLIPNNACLSSKWENFYNYNSYMKDNNYYIEYALYYLGYFHYISPNGNLNLIINAYLNKDDIEPICLKESVGNNLDKFIKYRFAFVREDDNFIFDHVELV